MSNFVFIAASLDGYIARKDDSIDWLTKYENPDEDYGYNEFIAQIDAIVMGRGTFEVVSRFESWPYTKPVFVLSTHLKPDKSKSTKIEIVSNEPFELVKDLHSRGYQNLYIDGGKTITSFLAQDLIDELIITRIPILLGSGIPLFGFINKDVLLAHVDTVVYPNGLVKSHYKRL